ncbi:MAG: valine--tRNA ligase [Patescibacteria group bacterium]
MNDKFLKPYNPAGTESRIYDLWEKSGYFNPDNLPARHKNPFCIVLPPPNATGTLHIGGSLMTVIQDIIVRYKRMVGFKTLWLPGTDHAAIATNAKVEKILYKEEGKSRHDIGREDFVAKVEKFVEENRGALRHQISKMGTSLDWSREAFTFDEKRNLAVRTAFKKMYDAGLIYRGTRIINWDPKGQTTISDDEIVYEEREAKLYTFKYSSDFPIAISTTRPETKLGDTAVAVHPDDERYKKFVGQTFKVNFAGAELQIKVVADESVDMEFGTGALGVTPAHSSLDAEIAKRHNLPSIQVINEYAKISLPIPGLEGEKTISAREKIVDWLKKEGLLIAEENIVQNISTAERTGGIIEPLPKLQWFVDVNKKVSERKNKSLKELMYNAVASGEIKILPERFDKEYFNWINNLHDWNISRQLWYGHRIPVWYRENDTYVGVDKPAGDGWVQDEDTLDTWFSSGLWTFSALGWPEKTPDLETYHPTDILETGYDIIFFWVARMILMSEFILGEIPFRTVYLHGLVRNERGEKLSKSLGDNIDPVSIGEQYGTDALRMALIVGVGPGSDSKLGNDKLKAYKNFANKVWNIARYVLSQENQGELKKELVEEFDTMAKDITVDMDNFRFYLAAEKIYHYIWHRLADEILEESKKDPSLLPTTYYLLQNSLKLLHPFMPFITEEIWSELPIKNKKMLMIENWPFDSAQGKPV